MIIGQIKDGIVLDHITAGRGMEIYKILHLDANAFASVSRNASSLIPFSLTKSASASKNSLLFIVFILLSVFMNYLFSYSKPLISIARQIFAILEISNFMLSPFSSSSIQFPS